MRRYQKFEYCEYCNATFVQGNRVFEPFIELDAPLCRRVLWQFTKSAAPSSGRARPLANLDRDALR